MICSRTDNDIRKQKTWYTTYVLAPEGVVDSGRVDGHDAERNAAQVVRQPAVVGIFRVACECVVARRHGHANL